jgi:hypothetical protein
MLVKKVICDSCNFEQDNGIDSWATIRLSEDKNSLIIFPEIIMTSPNDKHLCGSSCVLREVSAFLDTQNTKQKGGEQC